MDHSDALQQQAAEKYVLGELSEQAREEYEDHYFECHECAMDLEATASLVEGSRSVLRTDALKHIEARRRAQEFGGRFPWLRPAFAVPIFALLALIVGFQNLVTIPRLKAGTSSATKLERSDFVSLVGADGREEGARLFRIRRDRPAILELDIPPASGVANYVCELEDEAGRSLFLERVAASDAKRSVHFILPRGELRTGKYAIIILSEGDANSGSVSQTEIARLRFTIELVP